MANFGIVILAAGNSSRMGQPKQLLDFGGQPLIRHAAQAAIDSRGHSVVVVCGQFEDEIRGALHGLAVEIAPNPHWAGGMGTSIQAGLRALAPYRPDGVILTLGDLPMLTSATYNQLLDAHSSSAKPIVASAYAGTVGVPVLFTKEYFEPLMALTPAQGCKGIILAHEGDALRLPCPEAEADVDTPVDYARALCALAGESAA